MSKWGDKADEIASFIQKCNHLLLTYKLILAFLRPVLTVLSMEKLSCLHLFVKHICICYPSCGDVGSSLACQSLFIFICLVFQKYCEELQANMRLLEQEVLQLRQGAGQDTTAVSRENSQPLLELLEHMTGLSVSSLQDSADSHKYMCTVVDGALRGTINCGYLNWRI